MIDDRFFDEFDEFERKRKDKLEQEKREKEKEEFRRFLKDLTPTFLKYIEELKKRNVKIEHSVSDQDIKFMLFYNDGGEHGFSLNFAGITYYCTNHDGRRTSTEDSSYTKYSGEKIASLLQKVIKEYQFNAERHKGMMFDN